MVCNGRCYDVSDEVLKLLDDYNVNAFSLFDTNEALLETIGDA